MENVYKNDEELFDILKKEIGREEYTLELIASENFTSKAIMEMAGSVMTNKYAEGYPAKDITVGASLLMKLKIWLENALKNFLEQVTQTFSLILVLRQIWLFFNFSKTR